MIFNKLKEKLDKKTESLETQVVEGVVQNLVPTITTHTVLGDILSNPECFKLEIYFQGNELHATVKPREQVIVLTREEYERITNSH